MGSTVNIRRSARIASCSASKNQTSKTNLPHGPTSKLQASRKGSAPKVNSQRQRQKSSLDSDNISICRRSERNARKLHSGLQKNANINAKPCSESTNDAPTLSVTIQSEVESIELNCAQVNPNPQSSLPASSRPRAHCSPVPVPSDLCTDASGLPLAGVEFAGAAEDVSVPATSLEQVGGASLTGDANLAASASEKGKDLVVESSNAVLTENAAFLSSSPAAQTAEAPVVFASPSFSAQVLKTSPQQANLNVGDIERKIQDFKSAPSTSSESSAASNNSESQPETRLAAVAEAAGLELSSLLSLAKSSNDALIKHFLKNPEQCRSVMAKFGKSIDATNAVDATIAAVTDVPMDRTGLLRCLTKADTNSSENIKTEDDSGREPDSSVPPPLNAPNTLSPTATKTAELTPAPEFSSPETTELPSSRSESVPVQENVMIATRNMPTTERQMSAPVETEVVENLKCITNPLTYGINNLDSVRAILVPWAQHNRGNRTFAEKAQVLNLVSASTHEIQVAVLDSRVLSVMCNWLFQALNLDDNVTLGCIVKAFSKFPVAFRHLQVNKRFLLRVFKSVTSKTSDQNVKSLATETLRKWISLEQTPDGASKSTVENAPSSSGERNSSFSEPNSNVSPNSLSGSSATSLPPPKLDKSKITNRSMLSRPIESILNIMKTADSEAARPAKPYVMSTPDSLPKIKKEKRTVDVTANDVNDSSTPEKPETVENLAPGVQKKTLRPPGITGILKKISCVSKVMWPSTSHSQSTSSKKSVRWRDTLDGGQIHDTKFFCSYETPSGAIPPEFRKEAVESNEVERTRENESRSSQFPHAGEHSAADRGYGTAMNRSEGLAFRQRIQTAFDAGGDAGDSVNSYREIPMTQQVSGSSVFPWSLPKQYPFFFPRGIGTRAKSAFSSSASPFAIPTTPMPPTPQSPDPYSSNMEIELKPISISISEEGDTWPQNVVFGANLGTFSTPLQQPAIATSSWGNFGVNPQGNAWFNPSSSSTPFPILGTMLPGMLPTESNPYKYQRRDADGIPYYRSNANFQAQSGEQARLAARSASNASGIAFPHNAQPSSNRQWGASGAPNEFRSSRARGEDSARGARGGPYFGGRGRRRAGHKFSRGGGF